jgi:hypothetical protein
VTPYHCTMAEEERTRGFHVRDPAGDVIATYETFEQAKLTANEQACTAKLPAFQGICWEVIRNRKRRRPRVLHRAYPQPSPPPSDEPGGSSGPREPRRPRPGSSSGTVELELPD